MPEATIQEIKVCNQCGVAMPYTSEFFYPKKPGKLYARCKECIKNYSRNYRQTHKDRRRETNKRWDKKNPEKRRAMQKKWNDKNIERLKKWRNKWNSENPEKLSSYYKKYRKTHPHKVIEHAAKRRSRKLNLPATFTNEQWEQCKNYFNCRCAYCGKKDKNLQQDHLIPLTAGGNYTANNIVPACGKCNRQKWTKNFFEWYSGQSFYSRTRERKILKYLNYLSQDHQQMVIFEIKAKEG